MLLTGISDSIEGELLGLQTRKFLPRPPRKDEIVGKIVYPFKLTILARATVTGELVPKRPIWSPHSHLNVGDELQGESIEGHASKPLRTPSVAPATGRHKASFLIAKGPAFAKLEIPVRARLQQKPAIAN
jgi:hypothetical protein